MGIYDYKAKTIDDKIIKGSQDARNLNELTSILKDRQLFLVAAKDVSAVGSKKLKYNELAEFSRSLQNMIGAGVSINQAMNIIADDAQTKSQKSIFRKLVNDMQEGNTLSEAMKLQPNYFPELFINMVSSGEDSGKMESTVAKLSNHYDKEYKNQTKIKQAMAYPMFLGLITIIVVLIIFTFVLPNFFEIFEGIELPRITKIIMGISGFVTGNFYSIIVMAIGAVLVFKFAMEQPNVRYSYDKFILKMPKIGRLLRIIYTSRFARTLSSLYSSGLPMVNAVESAAHTVGNSYVNSQFGKIINDLRQGEGLSECIGKVDGFDKKLKTTVYIGEESGRLENMLEGIAEAFDYESEVATTKLIAFIGPIMIVFLAVVIGVIMLSVMLPILSIYNNIG